MDKSSESSAVRSIAGCQESGDRRSENLNAHLLDLAFEPIFVRRLDGTITYWNKGAVELYGYSKGEAEGANSHALLRTVFPIPLADLEQELTREGKWIGELIQVTKNGRKLIVESRQQAFDQTDGQPLVLVTNRDITVRETQYRMIFEGMQEGVSLCLMLYDDQGRPADWIYLDANPALEKIHGILGLAGRRGSELFPGLKESSPELLEMYGRVAQTGMPDNFEGYLDTLGMWVNISVFSPVKHHFITIGKDISERKRAENELRLAKERLDHLVSSSPVVIYSCQASGDLGATYISGNLTQQMGYEPQDFTSDSGFWARHIHPDDAPRVFTELQQIFELGTYAHEYRFLHKNGTYRWVHDDLRLVRDQQGEPLEIVGAWSDITEQKIAQDELFTSEQRLGLALDSAKMGAWDWNLNTDAIWWDNHQHKLFGIRPENFSGRGADALQVILPEDREQVKAAIDQALTQGEVFRAEFRVMHPDGSIRWLDGRGQLLPIAADGSRRMIGVNFDITERKQGDQERDKYTRLENLAQMHRLHIAGEFAALLAHQLNQPLTAIRSFAEAGIARLRRGIFEPQEMRETLEDVVTQSERAAGSIRDLRKFLARQPQEKSAGDLNAEVRAACTLMEVLARGRNIPVKLDLAGQLPAIVMRPSQIEQVIINLMENAMDAIAHSSHTGGVIQISTKFDPAHKEVIAKVVDSGPGLDGDSVARVFDPLYTTKKNGIGMGLVISRSIIQDHGGRIWAEPGPGGRFVFTLPTP
jgi:PAS domain S-box-containing protein